MSPCAKKDSSSTPKALNVQIKSKSVAQKLFTIPLLIDKCTTNIKKIETQVAQKY
jgi:hypothetical protein